ncbi:Dyp-type peroxidase [Amycolatopsis sp. K13G38]|uniref:Dyp-type peroxidase n=1 Tax=Amycolatopsis acididurans TaxID=2724524 RepID=A0ABX1IX04_9PSEU|nr:Dyp-type peroxidase [Amycolatopsis acididurans]NKQ51309.1 Dyp-type peroxidase [Amycolatopsis acididurans]
MKTTLDLADTQGLVMRGYGKLPYATFLLFTVDEAHPARAALGHWAEEVTTAAMGTGASALNVAVTAAGLRALGLPGEAVEAFSPAYAEGMTTEHRKRLLGDLGEADPQRWAWGGPTGAAVHLLLLVYAATAAELRRRVTALRRAGGGLSLITELRTDQLSGTEPFGFRDGLSQPRIEGLGGTRDRELAVGEFVLGYPNSYGEYGERPLLAAAEDPRDLLPLDPAGSGRRDFGRGGSYLVLRQLQQDVDGFWRYMREHSDDATWLAAKMVGRWPSGAPLALSPEQDEPGLAERDFAYHAKDPDGVACPIGSHVRRANPRDSLEPRPGSAASLRVNDRHRLLRRARSYTAGAERGLYFLCLNGNLARQYEFVQHTWINSPHFDGLHDAPDPVVAPRNDGGPVFTVQARPVRERYRSLPSFVRVRGGAYFFLPGAAALRYLAAVPG